MKPLASFGEAPQRRRTLPPSLPAHKSNGKGVVKLSVVKRKTAQPVDGEACLPLTAGEAIAALVNQCAKIRVIDTRTGRWLEFDGDASLIPYLRGLSLETAQNGSGSLFRLVMNPEINRRRILNSWKEISAYLGRGVRTIQRYEVMLGLPVRRAVGHPRCAVLAFSDELDAWLESRPMQGAYAGVAHRTVSILQPISVVPMA